MARWDKSKPRRVARLTITLTDKEKIEIAEKAASLGLEMSDFVRATVFGWGSTDGENSHAA